MNRRQFLLSSTVIADALIGSLTAVEDTNAAVVLTTNSEIDAISEIKKLRINSGGFTGGYQVAPAGELNWYFVNLGLTAILPHLTAIDRDTYVRSYLDLYLKKLGTNATIQDVEFVNGSPAQGVLRRSASDSDDSYAATFLTLAASYVTANNNWTWLSANKSKLKNIANFNLATSAKQSGLVSAFQLFRKKTNNPSYLMDQCEDYRGLRDLSAILRKIGDSDADYYDSLANGIVNGIRHRLLDSASRAFVWNDTLSYAETNFYPGTTCQVYPQAYGLVELADQFANGWNFLGTNSPNWQDGHYDNDHFPWAILGFIAAQRGFTILATEQTEMIRQLFLSQRSRVRIHELGWYLRMQDILAIAHL